MITTEIKTRRRSPTCSQLFLIARAPSGAILAHKYLSRRLSAEEVAMSASAFADYWARKAYTPLPQVAPSAIVVHCPEILL